MPVSVDFNAERSFVVLRYSGETGFADWQRAVCEVLARSDFRPGLCWLSDRRDAADIPDAEYIRRLAQFIGENAAAFRGCGWAIVTSSTAGFGMARMAAMLVDRYDVEMRGFQDYAAAIAWLQANVSR